MHGVAPWLARDLIAFRAVALTRRIFLRVAAAAPALGPVLVEVACGGSGNSAAATAAGFLTRRERTILDAALAVMIPTDQGPGAHEAQVVDYVDGLLAAFFTDPPRIYAGGPYSGRHGGANEFRHFLPLTRAQELAWRIRIEGSQGRAEREFNGPVVGWQQLYRDGLAALDDQALATHDVTFDGLTIDERSALLSAASVDFKRTLYQHACEGMYGDPVYRGNAGSIGWTFIQYEGDRQPIGYDRRAMEERDEGT